MCFLVCIETILLKSKKPHAETEKDPRFNVSP